MMTPCVPNAGFASTHIERHRGTGRYGGCSTNLRSKAASQQSVFRVRRSLSQSTIPPTSICLGRPCQTARGVLDALASDQLISPCSAGGWNITNVGAILFAKDINNFKSFKAKGCTSHSVQRTGPYPNTKRAGRRKGIRKRFSRPDFLYQRTTAVERDRRAGPPQDSAHVS